MDRSGCWVGKGTDSPTSEVKLCVYWRQHKVWHLQCWGGLKLWWKVKMLKFEEFKFFLSLPVCLELLFFCFLDSGSNLITAANFCLNGKFAAVGTYDGRCIFYETEVQLKLRVRCFQYFDLQCPWSSDCLAQLSKESDPNHCLCFCFSDSSIILSGRCGL